jgi:hypothetical protein
MNKFKISLHLICFFIFITALHAQRPPSSPNWDSWNFLLGEWVGEGSGKPGQATGGFTFSSELQNRILVRKNFADYPATKEHPAFSHNDLMVIYKERGDSTNAIYWDNEGHVINYSVEFPKDTNTITLVSTPNPTAPQFRFTYTKTGVDKLKILFEIAPPGKPDTFSKYIEATAHRKK